MLIVGYSTEHERLFAYTDRKEAREFAKANKLGIVRAIATQIPEDLAVELFGE